MQRRVGITSSKVLYPQKQKMWRILKTAMTTINVQTKNVSKIRRQKLLVHKPHERSQMLINIFINQLSVSLKMNNNSNLYSSNKNLRQFFKITSCRASFRLAPQQSFRIQMKVLETSQLLKARVLTSSRFKRFMEV